MIHAYPNNWTPKNAHRFATKRIEKIKFLLEEIAHCYDDVDQYVVNEADAIYHGFSDLEEALKNSLDEGRNPF